MDIEQPIPSEVDPESTFDGIVEPIREEMPDAMLTAVAHAAACTATYYTVLIQADVPPKRAFKLTQQWMDMCGVDE